jgi:N-acetylneuraminate lyase
MARTRGLIAATHTPLHSDGRINADLVPSYFNFLKHNGIMGIFLNGTTSEGYHLTTAERKTMTEAWCRASSGSDFRIFVFCGNLSGQDAIDLASHAATFEEVHGISATGPFYQNPSTPELLAAYCAQIASAAPHKPFYYYHIPVLTGIHIPMAQFLPIAGSMIPNLAGVKYSHADLEDLMLSQDIENGKYEMLTGVDEIALANRALGAEGFIGSTYNFLAPLFHRMFEAFDSGNHNQARQLQKLAVRIVRILVPYGYISASKFIMGELGIPNGPVRLPNRQIREDEKVKLLQELKNAGFFDHSCKPL